MPENKPVVSASYLTTEEDYRNFRVTVRKLRVPKWKRMFSMTAGILMIAMGTALLYFDRGRLYDTVAWYALLLIGMFTVSYYDIIVPYLTKRDANAEFAERKRILVAQNIAVHQEYLKFNTDRYSAEIPYKMLYKCIEDSTLFLFYTGEGEVRFLPKRVLAEGEAEKLGALLREKLKENYDKAG